MNSSSKEKEINNTNFWIWNGFKVYWDVQGEKNKYPIIFLHGFGASSKHWRNNIDYFVNRNFAAYSLDLLGFGQSDQPGIKEIGRIDNGVWSNQVKDFIEEIIKPKNSNKVVLIGNSLGSLVALTCAVTLESEISAVVASPLPEQIKKIYEERPNHELFKSLKDCLKKLFFLFFPLEIILFLINKLGILKLGLSAAYNKKDHLNKELIDMVRRPVLRRTAARTLRAMCIGMTTREINLKASYLLEKLSISKKVPFLLIWGEKDNFIPLFLGKKIANLHRWVELKIITNSGHCVHDEDPSLFNRISYEWIRDLKTF